MPFVRDGRFYSGQCDINENSDCNGPQLECQNGTCVLVSLFHVQCAFSDRKESTDSLFWCRLMVIFAQTMLSAPTRVSTLYVHSRRRSEGLATWATKLTTAMTGL